MTMTLSLGVRPNSNNPKFKEGDRVIYVGCSDFRYRSIDGITFHDSYYRRVGTVILEGAIAMVRFDDYRVCGFLYEEELELHERSIFQKVETFFRRLFLYGEI